MKGKDKDKPLDFGFHAKREAEVIGSAVEVKAKDKPLKPVEYDVLQGPNLEHLIREINEYIKAGWEPAGGVSYSPKMGLWYQALIIKI